MLNALGWVVGLAALVFTGGWILGIRRLRRVTPYSVNITMLFTASLAYVAFSSSSPLMLLVLFPCAWLIGTFSFIFPLSIPGRIFFELVTVGVKSLEVDDNPGFAPTVGEIAAFDELKRVAEQGQSDAQLVIAREYTEGIIVKRDLAEAARWYQKAAEGGSVEGQFELGKCYEEGKGVPPDEMLASAWTLRAAEEGHVPSQHRMAVRYALGNGVQAETERAVKWIERAAVAGFADAQLQLGQVLIHGVERPKDHIAAYMWISLARDQRSESDPDSWLLPVAKSELHRLEALMAGQEIEAARKAASCWQPSAPVKGPL